MERTKEHLIMDMKLEVIVIPVSDVDRAKEFYKKLGWRLDVTPPFVVQFTPPGSWCSVQFGKNLTSAAPGSSKAYLIVSDIVATRNTGRRRRRGERVRPSRAERPGQWPGSRASQLLLARDRSATPMATSGCCRRSRPGFQDASTLAQLHTAPQATWRTALRRAAAAHGEHEKRIGKADANWPEWYAKYMVAEQSGEKPPQ